MGNDVAWLPTQPYNCLPVMHPGQRMLMRFVGASRDLHPFHPHGNHATIVGRDGRMLSGLSAVSREHRLGSFRPAVLGQLTAPAGAAHLVGVEVVAQLADGTYVFGEFVAVGSLGVRCEQRLHGVSHPLGVHRFLQSFVSEIRRGSR